jgi:hypothetical protein
MVQLCSAPACGEQAAVIRANPSRLPAAAEAMPWLGSSSVDPLDFIQDFIQEGATQLQQQQQQQLLLPRR